MKRLYQPLLIVIIGASLLLPQSRKSIGHFNPHSTNQSKLIKGNIIKATKESNKMDPVLRYILKKADINNLDKMFNTEDFIRTNPMLPLRKTADNVIMIPAFVKSRNINITSNLIRINGGSVSTIADDILAVEIPLSSVRKIVRDEETIFLESCRFYKPLLNISHTEIEADKVHTGTELPRSYKGDGVIVGIVDSGIDWKHEDFADNQGSRIVYLWDMSEDLNPPTSYDFGTEYTKAQIDSSLCRETDSDGHGTHIAAIAAGSDNAFLGYTGIAPESDIIFVKAEIDGKIFDKNIIDGCNYIFSKAEVLEKSAVINISLGHHSGPHDGTSLADQAYSNLTGPGRIIVTSAGNSGFNFNHLSYETSGTDFNTAFKTYWIIPDTAIFSFIDMWYDIGNISVGIAAYDSNYQLIGYTEPVAPGEKLFSVPFRFNEQTYGYVSIDATTTADPNNNAKRIEIIISRSQLSLDEVIWGLYTFGTGTFDAWMWGGFGSFSSESDLQNRIMPADNYKTIGEPGTAEKVICVGSYVTKNEWIDIDGNTQYQYLADNSLPTYGNISFFSSIGPTRDNRLKPDLVAPGEVIFAALSSDLTEVPRKNILLGSKHQKMRGTSMACPHVTGTVALMLEVDPSLDYHDVFDILTFSAVKDNFTGSNANNTFGNGKLNTLNSVQEVIITGTQYENDVIQTAFVLFQNYPNPFNPVTTIEYNIPLLGGVRGGLILVILKIYNILGNEVTTLVNKQQKPGYYEAEWNAIDQPSGVYFYKVTAGNFTDVKKMILLR